jgi:peptide/nickel transport system substrate-binding protein
MRGRARTIAALAALALMTAACTGGSSGNPGSSGSSSVAVKNGGTLRLGTLTGIDSMNPFVAFSQDSYSIFEYIYPFLVQYDTKTMQFAPDFATSWEESSDGLTWTFHTRPNAKWSDGQPLTADDAAWTFNETIKYEKGPTAGASGTFSHVQSVTAPDPNTLVITYKRPVAVALPNLQTMPILPPQVWSKYFTGDGKEIRTFPNVPENGKPLVSGGPFEMVKYVNKQIALFQKNPNYYGTPAHIDGFGLQYFDNDDAMISALKTHELDAGESPPVTSIADLKAGGVHVAVVDGLEFHDFIFNSNPKKPEHRELLNPLVRQAFEYAIDRNQIVKTAWLGYAQPGTTIVPPGTGSWHDSAIKPLPFDLAKANQILDSLGYAKGSNGVRVADGHPMSYTVIFPHDEQGAGDRAFTIMQNDLRQIGVQIIQKPMDDTAAFNAILNPDNKYLTFDLAMWDWVPEEDPDFILSVLTCVQYGNWSDSAYCNSAYDAMYAQQSAAVDPKVRQQIVYKMQQQLFNDRPYIVINYQDQIDAWNTNWAGFIETNQGIFNPLSKESMVSVHQV